MGRITQMSKSNFCTTPQERYTEAKGRPQWRCYGNTHKSGYSNFDFGILENRVLFMYGRAKFLMRRAI